jgi:hypothetical protein
MFYYVCQPEPTRPNGEFSNSVYWPQRVDHGPPLGSQNVYSPFPSFPPLPNSTNILFNYSQDLVELAGPEEMKWPQKALYTYNVQNGDKFILDEKQICGPQRTRTSSSSSYLGLSPGSNKHESPGRLSFTMSPRGIGTFGGISASSSSLSTPRAKVSRNLFGAAESKGKNHPAGN